MSVRSKWSWRNDTKYILLCIFGYTVFLSIHHLIGIYLPQTIAYKNDIIIAAKVYDVYSLPFALAAGLLFIIAAAYGQDKKLKLSFKAFSESLNNESERKNLIGFEIVLIVLIIGLLITPLGFCHRKVMSSGNSFITYNSFNEVTHFAQIDHAEKMILDIRSRRKGGGAYIALTIVFDDEEYTFVCRNYPYYDFKPEMSDKEVLEEMLEIKSCFEPDEIEIKNRYRLPNLARKRFYDDEEVAMIYELFERN